MPVPPVIRYRVAGGPAYLLAWEHRGDDGWWGQIVWVEVTGTGMAVRRANAHGSDLAKIPGQDYRKVPRHQARPDPRPSDPTDPRDPGRMSRAEARTRHEMTLPQVEEPDF